MIEFDDQLRCFRIGGSVEGAVDAVVDANALRHDRGQALQLFSAARYVSKKNSYNCFNNLTLACS